MADKRKADTVLSAHALSGGYLEGLVIREVSVDIHTGDFLGIIGPNGSGKTTLLRLLSRVLPARYGGVTLEGTDIWRMPLREFCRRVAFVPQDTVTVFPFTVRETVLMGRMPHLGRFARESRRDTMIADEAMRMTDTALLSDKRFDELSAGERQRVVIARALTQQPKVLLLDEPTSHLDIGHQIQVLDLLKRLKRERALTIVMVLHDLNLASAYCNRVLLLHEGRVYTIGSPEEVLTYQNIEAVYKTVVVVNTNPLNDKPYVLLVSRER